MKGKVYIIGAGPGDIGLLTLKALECIKNADVIVYDRLMNAKLLSYCKADAVKIYAGKKMNEHTLPQEEINELLVKYAVDGKTVVRLKGGDPFVFGRGGEEALRLSEEGIQYEIVPGISSSIAAPTYAGIPITHRNISTSFHVITGHEAPDKSQSQLDFSLYAKLKGTLVFLMGISNLDEICIKLIDNGKAGNTPTAVIFNGTSSKQKTITGDLRNISKAVKMVREYSDPGIIVVGEAVELRKKLKWFEDKPLFGQNILVTRTSRQAGTLSKRIEDLGGNAVEFPTIQIDESINQLTEEIIEGLNKYQWIIFTSVNGVKLFFDKLLSVKNDIRSLGMAKLCAIGSQTKKELEKLSLKVEFVSDEYTAEGISRGLKPRINSGDKILIPRASGGRDVLINDLKDIKAEIKEVLLYKTEVPEYKKEELIKLLGDINIITFTSTSTVNNFIDMVGKDNIGLLSGIKVVSIGPITTQAAVKQGIKVNCTAEEFNIDGLIEGLIEVRNEV